MCVLAIKSHLGELCSSLLSVTCGKRGGFSDPGILTRLQCNKKHMGTESQTDASKLGPLPQKQSHALEPPQGEYPPSTPLGPQIFPVVLRTAKYKILHYQCSNGNTAQWTPTSENSKGIQSTQQKPKDSLLLWRVSICPLQHSKPIPPILSIGCKLPLVMSLHLNAQMCIKTNITGAQIPKQYTPHTYINIQMNPNKIKSAFRKERKWLGETICFEMRRAMGTTVYFLFRLASMGCARALAVMRMCWPMKKHFNCKDKLKTCNQVWSTDAPKMSL